MKWPPEEDECRECGFLWTMPVAEAIDLVASTIGRYPGPAELAVPRNPRPTGTWSPTEYLWHVVDVLRFGTERLWTLTLAPGSKVPSWDENELAAFRRYGELSADVGFVALLEVAGAWRPVAESAPLAAVIEHPEYGTLSTADVIRRNSHDVLHHLRDIERQLS
jgi:hypothetical protein